MVRTCGVEVATFVLVASTRSSLPPVTSPSKLERVAPPTFAVGIATPIAPSG